MADGQIAGSRQIAAPVTWEIATQITEPALDVEPIYPVPSAAMY
jgi:hypothetical protein